MRKRYIVAGYRLFFAGITAAALVTQLAEVLHRADASIVNFFSFFTVESNLLAAAVFVLTGALALRGRGTTDWDGLRGAATLYMTATGVIYVLLLSGYNETLHTAIPWVNIVLHYAMPLAVLADWLVMRPQRPVAWYVPVVWLAYPVLYLGYSMLRGHLMLWYPYPFLNPVDSSVEHVLVTCGIISAGMAAVAFGLAAVSRIRPKALY
jgi:hypothetical protein